MKRLLTAISVFTVSIAAIAQVETIALNHGANLDAKIYDDTLYIASDEGLYAYPLNVEPATWKLYAFGDRKVFNFVKSGPCLLAVTDETEVSGRQLSLQQSNDYGRTFTDVTPADASIKSEYNDFSGNVMQLWQHPKDQDMIYLAYPGTYGSGSVFDNSTMLASSDFGLQWKKKNKTPPCNARLAFSSNNASHIIACGLYPNVDCSCPYISETKDDFQNMTNVSYDIVDQDAKTIFHYNGIMATSEILFYQVAFSPDSDQQLIAATTSGIAKSEDGGLTWKFTLEDISPGHYEYSNQGDRSLIFLEPKHGCGSPPRCHILFIDWVGQGTLYSLDLPQTDKNLRAARADPNSFEVCRVAREIQQMLNPGYPWIFGELVVSLAG